MLRKVLALSALAALACAPAAAQAPKAPAAKAPAAKAPAAKAASAAFDARDPAALIAILNGAGAKALAGQRVEDTVPVTVTSAAANFTVQFVGCNPQGKACQATLYDYGPVQASPTLAQINGFNQSSALCRAYQDRGGKPHVIYSALVFPNMTRDQVVTQIAAWQGCLGDFSAFAKDPVSYLASAP